MELSQISARGRIWYYVRRPARPHRHAEAAVQRRHEPQDGRDLGNLPDSLGSLWYDDRVDEHRYVECDRGSYQLPHRFGVSVFSSPQKPIVISCWKLRKPNARVTSLKVSSRR